MYQAFYGFRGKPFQLTPDPGLIFPSRGHKRAMSYLLYGLEQGEGFVMITGAVGTGKTLLIQALMEQLSSRNVALASIASANLDDSDILPAVASAFALPYEERSKEALLQNLKGHLVSLRTHHTHALLVVDEAQTLAPAALEMLRILSNFELHGEALLQVFLVGQTELRRTIVHNHMEQLRQRVVASYRLEPLQQDESEAYILHRLRSVGWKGDPELSAHLFPKIQHASGGIPRKINLIMDRLLLYGYLEETHRLGLAALNTVLKEMGEEMTGIPVSLEAPAGVPTLDLTRATAASEREVQLAVLETKLNDILKLMREKIRLKEMLRSEMAPAEGPEDTELPEARHAHLHPEAK